MEIKKNRSVDYTKYRILFLGVGLCISILCVFIAFEAKAKYIPGPGPDLPEVFTEWLPVIPPTVFPEKKAPIKPKPKSKSLTISAEPIQEVLEEIVKEIIQESIVDESLPTWEDTDTVDVYTGAPPGFRIIEKEATFPGGAAAWMKFLRKNFKYPRHAKRAGIEGKVFLSFYVDREGMISNIKVIRGIGGGCDEEAIRVLKKSPRWHPGEQRGNAVKSQMSLYINFVLK